jgi:hypothetical protein
MQAGAQLWSEIRRPGLKMPAVAPPQLGAALSDVMG